MVEVVLTDQMGCCLLPVCGDGDLTGVVGL